MIWDMWGLRDSVIEFRDWGIGFSTAVHSRQRA